MLWSELSDIEKVVAKKYGAYKEGKKTPNRITAIIGKDGKILHTITDVNTADHTSQIFAVINKKEK